MCGTISNFRLSATKGISGRREIDDAIARFLDDVGLTQTIRQMPSELSAVRRNVSALPAPWILQPEIMLYDEPTAGLDPVTAWRINDLINEVQERYNTSAVHYYP